MSICIVQNIKDWLIIARWAEGKINYQWESLPFKIPHEYEDIGFLRACKYLKQGYGFYPYDLPLGQGKAIEIPSEVLKGIEKDESIFDDSFDEKFSISTAYFWQNVGDYTKKVSQTELKRIEKEKSKQKELDDWKAAKEKTKLPIPHWMI